MIDRCCLLSTVSMFDVACIVLMFREADGLSCHAYYDNYIANYTNASSACVQFAYTCVCACILKFVIMHCMLVYMHV